MKIITEDILGIKYEILTEKYSGLDTYSKCFIFQGQGGIHPGMGADLYKNFQIARDLFDIADKLFKENNKINLSLYITNPKNIKEADIALYGNVCLFVLEVVIFNIIKDNGTIPKIITAHSFGEYAAIHCSGIVSFEEMLFIVFNRELLSEAKNKIGYLVALKHDISNTEKIKKDFMKYCNKHLFISNINKKDQFVVAIDKESLIELEQFLTKSDIIFKTLSAPQPYHSALMNETAEKFSIFIDNLNIKINKPSIDLISSVTGNIVNKNNCSKLLITNILKNQLTKQVDFIKQINYVNKIGINNFVEIGVIDIFSKMIYDILPQPIIKSTFFNISSTKLDNISENIDNKEYKKISKYIKSIIGKVTGYEIESISIEDRIQEDLKIDSIKKADIVFQIMNKNKMPDYSKVELEKINNVKDLVKLYINEPVQDKVNNIPEKWNEVEIKMINEDLGENIYDSNIELNDFCHCKASDILLDKDFEISKNNLILLLDIGITSNNLYKIVIFFRSLRYENYKNIILISYNFEEALILSSFLKSIKREYPYVNFKHISFTFEISNEDLMLITKREIDLGFVFDVLYTDKNKRSVQSIIKSKEIIEKKDKIQLNKKVFVFVGGGELVNIIVNYLIANSRNNIIYILNRNNNKKINNPNINYITCDATRTEDFMQSIDYIKEKHFIIDYLINSAGLLDINNLLNKSDEIIRKEMETKITISENIIYAKEKNNIQYIILFSSILSLTGSHSQSIYSLSNEYLNYVSKTKNGVLSINWPALEKVGMTAINSVYLQLKNNEVKMLSKELAVSIFVDCIMSIRSGPLYYMPTHNSLFNFMLGNLDNYKNMLGIIENNQSLGSNFIFKKYFATEEKDFYSGHIIKNKISIPGAYFITAISLLTLLSYHKNVLHINNTTFHNLFTIEDDKLFMLIKMNTDYKNNINIGFFREDGIAPYTNSISEMKEEMPSFRDFNNITFNNIIKNKEEFYNIFQDEIIFGESFRFIDKLSKSEDECYYSYISFLGKDYIYSSKFDKLLRLIDSGFQIIGYDKYVNNKKGIPSNCDDIYIDINKLNNNNFHLFISKNKDNYSIFILNDNNEKCIFINKVNFK